MMAERVSRVGGEMDRARAEELKEMDREMRAGCLGLEIPYISRFEVKAAGRTRRDQSCRSERRVQVGPPSHTDVGSGKAPLAFGESHGH